MASESAVFPVLLLIAGGLSVLCLFGTFRCLRRRRLIDDTPTSKTQGVFIGLVELKGSAESESPLSSFLAAVTCVYYVWRVQEHWSRTVTETYRDAQGRSQTRTRHESGWTTVAEGREAPAFYLRDDTGTIRILPTGAQVEALSVFDRTCTPAEALYYGKAPVGAVANSDHRRRFAETAIPLHAALYVMGQARERTDVVAPEIAAAPEAALFLISTRTEQGVRAGYGRWSVAWTVAGLLAALAVPLLVIPGVRAGPGGILPACTLTAGLYLILAGAGWIWTVFNSLITLQQRVRQAWAQVDIQLRRRHDLIPTLVAAVQGYQAHEAAVQAAITCLRAQLSATPTGVPGPDYAGCGPALRAAVESYPELKANELFLRLQQNLTDAEQRISLARSYFNAIATFFNTRLERVPDRFVAGLARLRPATLMLAADFERTPIQIRLVE